MAYHWVSVKCPEITFHEDDLRGSFHLAVDQRNIGRIWYQVQKHTVQGRLGYMSSLSPQPMFFGRLRGKWTISVHTLHHEKDNVLLQLDYLNLFPYLFKYDVIKKFRYYYDQEEEFYNDYQRSYY